MTDRSDNSLDAAARDAMDEFVASLAALFLEQAVSELRKESHIGHERQREAAS